MLFGGVGLKSPLGHKWPFTTSLAECLVLGAKQTFPNR